MRDEKFTPKQTNKTQHNTETMQTITGNTYPVKDAIKALGGKWNKTAKGWDVPDEVADEARALVSGASNQSHRHSYDKSTFYRMSSGTEIYRNRSGRCEDAPCCGCCTI